MNEKAIFNSSFANAIFFNSYYAGNCCYRNGN